MMRGSQTSSTQTVQVASNVDRSGAVLWLGGGLLVANFVFGGLGSTAGGSTGWSYLTGQTSTPPALNRVGIALAALGVFLLLLLAKTGEAGGNFAVILLAAAWVVWLLNSPGSVAKLLGQGASSSNTSTKSSSTGSKTK